jgi:hypothetical protein
MTSFMGWRAQGKGQDHLGSWPFLCVLRLCSVFTYLLGHITMKKPSSGEEGMYRAELGRTYERFLELPVPVVLLVLWAVGAVLEVLLVRALYWNGLVLVKLIEAHL